VDRLVWYNSRKRLVRADRLRDEAAVSVFIVIVRTMTANQSQGVCNTTIPETFTDLEHRSHLHAPYCRPMTSLENRAYSTFAVCGLGSGG
jgi:hypothetical protein